MRIKLYTAILSEGKGCWFNVNEGTQPAESEAIAKAQKYINKNPQANIERIDETECEDWEYYTDHPYYRKNY